MATVCQTCGDEGFSNALIFCDECQVYAVHRYCLPRLPATFDEYVVWLCDDCDFNVNLKKRSVRRKVNNCSLTKSKVSGIEKRLSVEIHEDCSKTIEKDQEFGRQDVLDENISNEVIESLESKNVKLDLVDHQPLESNCTDDGQKDEKNVQHRVLDEGSGNENECIKNPLVVMPPGANFSDEDEEGPKLERTNCINESYKEIEKLNGLNECILLEESCVHAQPIQEPIWRGSLNIFDKDHSTVVGLVAHVSNLACLKVSEEAKSMPASLAPELLPRSTVWPKGFAESRPRDDSIALYFFPDSVRKEKVFDSLVYDMIDRDIAMRIVLQNAELLIFSSTQLPLEFWRFQAKFYLWGVFKGKRSPPLAVDAIPEENLPLKALLGIKRVL